MKRYVLAALALLLSGCAHSKPFVLPPPPTTGRPPSTEAAIDYSKIGLPRVPGRTTTTVPVGPGPLTLQGRVVGPDGAVGGASVLIERLVGDGLGSLTVPTQPDGTWSAPNILGGRYRVRSWLAPSLAQVKPEVFFFSGPETRQVNLTVTSFDGPFVAAALAPDPPQVGESTSLVVAVTSRSVGSDGVVRATPIAHVSTELTAAGGWQVETSNPTTTDFSGQSRWVIRCRRSGSQPLSVVVGGTDSFPLNLAACEQPPDTTTSSTTAKSTTTTA